MSHVSFARAFMFLKVGFGGSPADFTLEFFFSGNYHSLST